jgi:hypothetical protein
MNISMSHFVDIFLKLLEENTSLMLLLDTWVIVYLIIGKKQVFYKVVAQN